MQNGIILTILTPTYNRCNKLNRLYSSLCEQTNEKFQWLIIDDGSIDNTEQYIRSLPKTSFQIDYHKKINGGKHTALNFSHRYIDGEIVCIVDSDDYLIPEAVETIIREWRLYRDNNVINGMSFCRCYSNGNLISKLVPKDTYIDNHISYRINKFITGDRCEVLRTDLFKKCIFPVFENEKFISENKLWIESAIGYQTVYRNKAIYVCEYLDNGLTKSGRAFRMKNPFGMMEDCKAFFIPQVSLIVQLKEMLLFWLYGFCAKLSIYKIAIRSGRPIRLLLVFPFGILLYLYWKRKYL